MKKALIVLIALVSVTGAAWAQEAARDPRLRVMPYEEGQVISIDGHLGYQMMIEFDPQERIENVSIGDSLAWQVTPNHAATLLFIKPVVARAVTNMIVVTTRRRYAFALRAREAIAPDDARIIYGLRFTYPDSSPHADAAPAPAAFNFNYVSSGARSIAPTRVFDDGRFTYFEMPRDGEVPAILALNAHGGEELVNSQMRADVIVVDRIAEAFILRYGRDTASVRRGDLAVEQAPRPRPRVRRGGRR